MDSWLIFQHRFCRGKGVTQKGRQSVPIGHGASQTPGDAGVGKSALDIAESKGKPRETRAIPLSPYCQENPRYH